MRNRLSLERVFSGASGFWRAPATLTAGVLVAAVLLPVTAQQAAAVSGPDRQIIRLGYGVSNSLCIFRGPNNTLQSTPSGDDTISGGDIRSGANGICESTPSGDDVYPSDIGLGRGRALSAIVNPGTNRLCRSPVTLQNDDQRPVLDPALDAVGTGLPRQVGVAPDPGSTIESTPAGDDVVTSVICPGGNGTIESSVSGDDQLVATVVDERCGLCNAATACITPGGNDVLESTVAGTDEEIEYVSTGTNGRSETSAAGTDSQAIPVGEGHEDTVCVNSGADGISDTLLCGNGVADFDENGIDIFAGGDCEDGNQVSGDGCNANCEPEFCGDGITQGGLGEQCDDGGTMSNDGCSSTCIIEFCGDGITQGGLGEQCDDGNTTAGDGCNATCIIEFCGDGITQGGLGEQCDTAGQSATCDANCTFAVCGDNTRNTAAGEQCDDGNTTPGDGCNAVCVVEFCGDGVTQTGLGEQCDTAGESATCDANCTFAVCGDNTRNTAAGEQCDDGNTSPNDGCDGVCVIEFCGDGILQDGIGEECDDGAGNSDTLPDTCRTDCDLPSCGDGVIDPGNSEVCDDGNNKNNDDCLVQLGCVPAVCGDGFKHTKGTPPLEECDDGGTDPGDGCDDNCLLEPTPGCGDSTIDSLCTVGTVGATCTQNSDCDVSPGDGVCTTEQCDDGNSSNKDDCLNNCVPATCGDGIKKTRGTPPFEECDDGNLQAGDGCSTTCVEECGNAVIDGACSQGTVGAPCQIDSDCDVSPGDGVCVTEQCDTGIDGLCQPTPVTCSDECTLVSCGNGVVECDEQCDLAVLNGVAGSGCTLTCVRNLIGKKEISGRRECPSAWTLDSPPRDPSFRLQRCTDGDSTCDFDGSATGDCEFRVGICLNRPQPANCDQSPIIAADLLRLKTGDPVDAAAAEALTDALSALTAEGFDAPGRCREGRRRKNCTVNIDCDSYLGAGDGICDVATGVAYTPPLTPLGLAPNQTTSCTPGIPVVVPEHDKLRLRLFVRRDGTHKSDKDSMKLSCDPGGP